MKNESISSKNDLKKTKRLMRKLDRLSLQHQQKSENLKRFRITQSVKAGHIRGGHGFH
ncbi:MAG: hypothetical protein HYR76_14420 [Ignavibacteria bacterium]|nr:hypothetical protein [Ignavibacteria bacterium]